MGAMGLQPPSVASLARIFRDHGVARHQPQKKPRAAYRRFVYPAPNACWQLDATDYVLTRGRVCTIFQLIDDHSRLEVASLVATAETSQAAVAVVKKGIAGYGGWRANASCLTTVIRPGNPSAALGVADGVELVGLALQTREGVDAITSKPCSQTTQGNNGLAAGRSLLPSGSTSNGLAGDPGADCNNEVDQLGHESAQHPDGPTKDARRLPLPSVTPPAVRFAVWGAGARAAD